jgi:hypothetical protein
MEWRWRGERERIGRKKKYQIKSNKDFCFLGGDRTEGKNHMNRKITHNPNVMCVCVYYSHRHRQPVITEKGSE